MESVELQVVERFVAWWGENATALVSTTVQGIVGRFIRETGETAVPREAITRCVEAYFRRSRSEDYE